MHLHMFFFVVRNKHLSAEYSDEQMNSLDGHFHEQMRYWLGVVSHQPDMVIRPFFLFHGKFSEVYNHTPSIFASNMFFLCLVGKHNISMGNHDSRKGSTLSFRPSPRCVGIVLYP